MSSAVSEYLEFEASAHRIDARSKIIMLAVYSVGIFFVDTWVGMAAYATLFLVALLASRVNLRKVFKVAVPVYVIAALTIFFNMFHFGSDGISFTSQGLVRGCFFAIRILLLVWSSLILCFTVSSTELTRAFNSLLSPLRALRVPTDDIAMVFSIALRFISLTVEEFFAVRDAQWSRGATFGEGPLVGRVKAYLVIFIPMFIGMFRRADRLALAMDARCYGMPGVRPTELRDGRLGLSSIAALLCASIACICISVLL